MLTKENNYDFRKRMQEVHEKNIRNNKLIPYGNELELKDGLTVFIPDYAVRDFRLARGFGFLFCDLVQCLG